MSEEPPIVEDVSDGGDPSLAGGVVTDGPREEHGPDFLLPTSQAIEEDMGDEAQSPLAPEVDAWRDAIFGGDEQDAHSTWGFSAKSAEGLAEAVVTLEQALTSPKIPDDEREEAIKGAELQIEASLKEIRESASGDSVPEEDVNAQMTRVRERLITTLGQEGLPIPADQIDEGIKAQPAEAPEKQQAAPQPEPVPVGAQASAATAKEEQPASKPTPEARDDEPASADALAALEAQFSKTPPKSAQRKPTPPVQEELPDDVRQQLQQVEAQVAAQLTGNTGAAAPPKKTGAADREAILADEESLPTPIFEYADKRAEVSKGDKGDNAPEAERAAEPTPEPEPSTQPVKAATTIAPPLKPSNEKVPDWLLKRRAEEDGDTGAAEELARREAAKSEQAPKPQTDEADERLAVAQEAARVARVRAEGPPMPNSRAEVSDRVSRDDLASPPTPVDPSKLFDKEKAPAEAEPAPEPTPEVEATREPLTLKAGAKSEAAKYRGSPEENEDAMLSDPEHGVFAVADGLGAHGGGKRAAEMVINAVRDNMSGEITSVEQAEAMFHAAISEARFATRKLNEEIGGQPGSTLVAAKIVETDEGPVLVYANAGDSALMIRRGSELIKVTSEHSSSEMHIRQRQEAGEELTEDVLVAIRSDGNVVANAISGDYGKHLDEVGHIKLEPGDRIVLVSDGVTGDQHHHRLSDPEMLTALAASDSERAVQNLELISKKDDDTTAIVFDLEGGFPADYEAPATSKEAHVDVADESSGAESVPVTHGDPEGEGAPKTLENEIHKITPTLSQEQTRITIKAFTGVEEAQKALDEAGPDADLDALQQHLEYATKRLEGQLAHLSERGNVSHDDVNALSELRESLLAGEFATADTGAEPEPEPTPEPDAKPAEPPKTADAAAGDTADDGGEAEPSPDAEPADFVAKPGQKLEDLPDEQQAEIRRLARAALLAEVKENYPDQWQEFMDDEDYVNHNTQRMERMLLEGNLDIPDSSPLAGGEGGPDGADAEGASIEPEIPDEAKAAADNAWEKYQKSLEENPRLAPLTEAGFKQHWLSEQGYGESAELNGVPVSQIRGEFEAKYTEFMRNYDNAMELEKQDILNELGIDNAELLSKVAIGAILEDLAQEIGDREGIDPECIKSLFDVHELSDEEISDLVAELEAGGSREEGIPGVETLDPGQRLRRAGRSLLRRMGINRPSGEAVTPENVADVIAKRKEQLANQENSGIRAWIRNRRGANSEPVESAELIAARESIRNDIESDPDLFNSVNSALPFNLTKEAFVDFGLRENHAESYGRSLEEFNLVEATQELQEARAWFEAVWNSASDEEKSDLMERYGVDTVEEVLDYALQEHIFDQGYPAEFFEFEHQIENPKEMFGEPEPGRLRRLLNFEISDETKEDFELFKKAVRERNTSQAIFIAQQKAMEAVGALQRNKGKVAMVVGAVAAVGLAYKFRENIFDAIGDIGEGIGDVFDGGDGADQVDGGSSSGAESSSGGSAGSGAETGAENGSDELTMDDIHEQANDNPLDLGSDAGTDSGATDDSGSSSGGSQEPPAEAAENDAAEGNAEPEAQPPAAEGVEEPYSEPDQSPAAEGAEEPVPEPSGTEGSSEQPTGQEQQPNQPETEQPQEGYVDQIEAGDGVTNTIQDYAADTHGVDLTPEDLNNIWNTLHDGKDAVEIANIFPGSEVVNPGDFNGFADNWDVGYLNTGQGGITPQGMEELDAIMRDMGYIT